MGVTAYDPYTGRAQLNVHKSWHFHRTTCQTRRNLESLVE